MTKELEWVKGNTPTEEGWYRVLHPGDSESIDGHTIYEYGDYQGWAQWYSDDEEEASVVQDEPGWGAFIRIEATRYRGWSCEHDEDGDFIIAFCGPIIFPELPTDLKS